MCQFCFLARTTKFLNTPLVAWQLVLAKKNSLPQ